MQTIMLVETGIVTIGIKHLLKVLELLLETGICVTHGLVIYGSDKDKI